MITMHLVSILPEGWLKCVLMAGAEIPIKNIHPAAPNMSMNIKYSLAIDSGVAAATISTRVSPSTQANRTSRIIHSYRVRISFQLRKLCLAPDFGSITMPQTPVLTHSDMIVLASIVVLLN